MDSHRVVSIHGDSYDSFWHQIFPSMWADSLRRMLASSKDQISFTVEVSDLEFRFQDDVSDENPEKYCRDWYLDYTQSVSCRLRIAKTGGLKTIHLGSIPKQTQEENFIINGKERSVIAQLVKSPGLTFHRGELLRKYTGSDGSCAVTK